MSPKLCQWIRIGLKHATSTCNGARDCSQLQKNMLIRQWRFQTKNNQNKCHIDEVQQKTSTLIHGLKEKTSPWKRWISIRCPRPKVSRNFHPKCFPNAHSFHCCPPTTSLEICGGVKSWPAFPMSKYFTPFPQSTSPTQIISLPPARIRLYIHKECIHTLGCETRTRIPVTTRIVTLFRLRDPRTKAPRATVTGRGSIPICT